MFIRDTPPPSSRVCIYTSSLFILLKTVISLTNFFYSEFYIFYLSKQPHKNHCLSFFYHPCLIFYRKDMQINGAGRSLRKPCLGLIVTTQVAIRPSLSWARRYGPSKSIHDDGPMSVRPDLHRDTCARRVVVVVLSGRGTVRVAHTSRAFGCHPHTHTPKPTPASEQCLLPSPPWKPSPRRLGPSSRARRRRH